MKLNQIYFICNPHNNFKLLHLRYEIVEELEAFVL